ncbi:MAG TPA: TIGR00725 family protein [Solirubrobacteraceae bacterium]|jgi:hypothetical protein|nr:TIGR00725 family protein [Solirubrobacteraceae bacterium]
MTPYVAVIGASHPTPADLEHAEVVGRGLAERGAIVVTGGRGGVMAAASRGAATAGGVVVGLLPGLDRREANEWATVAITTGLGELRNGLVVRAADSVVAVGGSYGTLSEIALALQAGTPVFGLHTWPIDGIRQVDSPGEAISAAFEAATAGPPEGLT